MPYVLLLIVAMPIIEIAFMLKVSSVIGWFPTLAIVIVTAVLGAAMLRQQGLATLNKARQRMDDGEMPAQQILEGILLLLGGVLLLTPGFVTDTFGFLCLLPPTRQWLAGRIARRSIVNVSGVTGFGGPAANDIGHAKTTVGSGATAGAKNSDRLYSEPSAAGGRPQPIVPDNSADGEMIDADFKRIDD